MNQQATRTKKRRPATRGKRIALASLASFLLLVGYVFLPRTPGKAIHHLVETEIAVEDPHFRESAGNLVHAPLTGHNRVEALQNGEEIFPAMFEAIRSARYSITMENFIFRSGTLSTQMVAALSERARAGVKVHVIIDALGSSRLADAEIDAMRDAGVDFVKYNSVQWHKMLRVNHRDHRKILVVDGKIGFTGGACLADEWLGNGDRPDIWRDTHFRVEGPVVSQIQGVFMDNWVQLRHRILEGPEYFPLLAPAGSAHAHCFKTGPRDGVETARLTYLYSISAARKHIRIAHAYFLPDDLLIEALLAARQRGVKIEIIFPGLIDAHVVLRASRGRWNELINAGVEFYEFQPAMLHCKIMIVDDVWVLAGTVNFDNRSFRINDENCFNVWDQDFAASLIRVFEEDKERSRRVDPKEFKGRPWYEKAMEHVAAWFRVWM